MELPQHLLSTDDESCRAITNNNNLRVGGRNGSGRQMLIHFFDDGRKSAKSGKLIRPKNDFKTMINGTKTMK